MREFTIDSRDMKTRLACYAWEPKGDPRAIIVLVHGMGDHALRYTEMAEYFMAEGILVAALDLLGHGSSAATPEDFGYFCEQDPATVIVRDVHRLKKTIQAEHPGVPIYLMGHSMGSYIARNYIERYG
ncbi:MAG TPA: alpha/beta hydrolase, partial [Lachnospiraceae bacterium]|nr:alpha/beta hydrolase [Lachnospiraceae bacterium]